MHCLAFSFPDFRNFTWSRQQPGNTPYFPLSTLRDHVRELTTLEYRESTCKSYGRVWQLFISFTQAYGILVYGIAEHQFMEFISYLSLVGLALATILLYVTGVKANLCWHSLPDFQNSFMICMMLKGVSVKYREPDICLPVTHDILHQMCQALLCIISDWYLIGIWWFYTIVC